MSDQNLDILLENQSLKYEFVVRELDLAQVFCPTPDNLERENRFLRHLLEWVEKYSIYKSRSLMEAEGYHFPPLDFDLGPDEDWYRFERWLAGYPIRQPTAGRLPPYYIPNPPDDLTDEEIVAELQTLTNHLLELRISVDFREDIPPRVAYTYLLECLEEEFDVMSEGFLHLDGCSGYCPGCFQRPWCKVGNRSCWPEDEEAGGMFLIDSLKAYVSPSPMSLSLLRAWQAEEDRKFEEFERNQKDQDISITPWPFDPDNDDGLPF